MIGGLYKYLFLSFFYLLIYLCFIITIIFNNIVYINNFSINLAILNGYLENNNQSQTSLCLSNNVFLMFSTTSVKHLLQKKSS